MEEDLNRDYSGYSHGHGYGQQGGRGDEVFRSLKGTCLELDSGEYTYEVCLMEKASQKPLAGRSGSNTNMGIFTRFDSVFVDDIDDDDDDDDDDQGERGGNDDDNSSGGTGEGGRRRPEQKQKQQKQKKKKRMTMRYENGQQCWNGPVRSTTVVLTCSEIDRITKVVEEEKCLYRIEMGLAAVCFGSFHSSSHPSRSGSGSGSGIGSGSVAGKVAGKEKGRENDSGGVRDEL